MARNKLRAAEEKLTDEEREKMRAVILPLGGPRLEHQHGAQDEAEVGPAARRHLHALGRQPEHEDRDAERGEAASAHDNETGQGLDALVHELLR